MCMKMQVLVTAVVVGLVTHFISGQPGPAAIVIGNGLALSSTAVVLQVMIRTSFTLSEIVLWLFILPTFCGQWKMWSLHQ